MFTLIYFILMNLVHCKCIVGCIVLTKHCANVLNDFSDSWAENNLSKIHESFSNIF